MSGVCKDKSAYLTYGGAGDCKVESKACKLFGSFKGPFCKSECTKKEEGAECTFKKSIKCERVEACGDEPASWKTSANWGFCSKLQTSGLTFGSTYCNEGKKWTTFCDWGDLYYPNLHFYSGADYSNGDDCDMSCRLGVIWGSKKFGFASELSRQFCDNSK